MAANQYANLASAYCGNLSELLERGHIAPAVIDTLSPASRFGERPRGAREIIGHQFRLRSSTPSIAFSPAIKIDLPFLFGQFVWFLGGSVDVAWLSYYAPHANVFSHDGHTLCGSFGRRIFGTGKSSDQARAVADLIRRDPGSRRALISVALPTDLLSPTKEFPCCSTIHFFLRDATLHAVCAMRAQQALTILPYDVFLFCGLQSILASELDVAPGTYTHSSGTLHFYDNEEPLARAVATSEIRCVQLPEWKGGFGSVDRVVSLESRIRSYCTTGDSNALSLLRDSVVFNPSSLEDVVSNYCLLIGFEKMKLRAEADVAKSALTQLELFSTRYTC